MLAFVGLLLFPCPREFPTDRPHLMQEIKAILSEKAASRPIYRSGSSSLAMSQKYISDLEERSITTLF